MNNLTIIQQVLIKIHKVSFNLKRRFRLNSKSTATYFCKACGEVLFLGQYPCHKCGSNDKVMRIELNEELKPREGQHIKIGDTGRKHKPLLEIIFREKLSGKTHREARETQEYDRVKKLKSTILKSKIKKAIGKQFTIIQLPWIKENLSHL